MGTDEVMVQRANVILRVPAEDADRYVDQGYSIIDSQGHILKASMPKDVGTLQRLVVEYSNQVKQLQKELEELKKPQQKPKEEKPKSTGTSRGKKS